MSASPRSFGPDRRPYHAAADIVLRLLWVFVPLIVVGAAFYFVVNRPQTVTGQLRVVTDIKGAEIFVDDVRMGATTDTTLPRVLAGRRSVTVRKAGYTSEPEVVFINVVRDRVAVAQFELISTDTVPPSRQDSLLFPEEMYQEIIAALEETLARIPQWGPETLSSLEEAPELIADEDDTTQDLATVPPVSMQPRPAQEKEIEGTSVAVSSLPQGAQIIMNGDSTGQRTKHTFYDLPRGTYFITVRKTGYVPKPEEVRIDLTRSHQSELVAFELSLDQSLPPPQLTIATEPIAAGIRVDGKPVGKGRVVVDALFGESVVEFEDVIGYETPPPQVAELTPESTSVEIIGRYQRLEGRALLAVMPARQKTVKGEGLRIRVDNELLVENPAESFQGILIHALVAGKRLVRVEYQGLVRDIHLELVDDKVSIVTFAVESFFSRRKLRLRSEEPIALEDWQKRTRRLTVIDLD